MYSSISRNLWLAMALFALTQTLIGQPDVKISGVSHGRPGYSAGLDLEIVRKGITGPVRIKLNLPNDWKAKSYGFDQRASLKDIDGNTTILWLSLPIVDTVRFSFDVRIPDSQALRSESVSGVMEYFTAEGQKKTISISTHQIRVMRYFTRYQ